MAKPSAPPALLSCCQLQALAAPANPDATELARRFKALGDSTRVRLLGLIAASPGGEACICNLTAPVGLSQPTVSHHMKLLADAGLVTRHQRGKWAYYSVRRDALDALSAALATPA